MRRVFTVPWEMAQIWFDDDAPADASPPDTVRVWRGREGLTMKATFQFKDGMRWELTIRRRFRRSAA